MNWGSIIGQLGALGASPDTMRVAFEGLRNSTQPAHPTGFGFPPAQPSLQQAQLQALNALIAQHRRPVDGAQLDLSGLWLSTNCWMFMVREGVGFSYQARNAFDDVVEQGAVQLSPVPQITAHNAQVGTHSLPLAIVNEDLLLILNNNILIGVMRRISSDGPKPYLR